MSCSFLNSLRGGVKKGREIVHLKTCLVSELGMRSVGVQ